MKAALAVVAALLTIPAAGMACGFHGSLGGGFSAQHARSLDVALALRDAADAGVVDGDQLKPKLADMLALNRAGQRLERLRGALQRAAADTALPEFALLLVESGMWNLFAVEAGVVRLTVHVEGPQPGGAVVVTGDAALTALAAGRLTPEEALHRGLVAIEGSPELQRVLMAALAVSR